jgi:hypothetical protein
MMASRLLWGGILAGSVLCSFGFGQDQFHWQWKRMKELWRAPIIRQLRVDSTERESIVDAAVKTMRADPEFFGDLGDAELHDLVENDGYMFSDLDGDGIPELITQGYGVQECGGVGNCTLRVYRRHGARYELILNVRAQTLMVDHSGARPLLVLYTHNSAMDGNLNTYSILTGEKPTKVMSCAVNWNNWPEPRQNTRGVKPGVPTLESCTHFKR